MKINHHISSNGAGTTEPESSEVPHSVPSPREIRTPGTSSFQFSSGAFQPPRAIAAAPPVQPTVRPKQPRGRIFVIGCVVSFLGFGSYSVYDGFFRYSAYGVIAGREIEVPSPKAGFVQFVHVQESDTVRQGQLLMTLYNPEGEAQLSRAEDNLQMARAKFRAGLARLNWNISQSDQDASILLAEIHEKEGLIQQEQTRLQGFQQTLSRLDSLHARKYISPADLERGRLDEQGQREKVEQLVSALEIRKGRAAGLTTGKTDRHDELLPLLAEISGLESERQRIRADIDRLQVRSPANGIVLRRHRFTGEGADFLQPLFTILEEESQHVELFVSQDRIHEFPVGASVNVQVAPFWDQLPCRVVRLGDEHVVPPTQVGRHYDRDVKTVPIYLAPDVRCLRHEHLQIGAVVKLPRTIPSVRSRGTSFAAPSTAQRNRILTAKKLTTIAEGPSARAKGVTSHD